MKNVKLISLVFAMLISFPGKAQKKTISGENSNDNAATIVKTKDTISDIKVSNSAPKIIICAPSRPLMNEPIYIMNGIVIDSKQLSKINPNDIENIKVLRGIEATSLYGNQAINGVIVVTTKRKKNIRISARK